MLKKTALIAAMASILAMPMVAGASAPQGFDNAQNFPVAPQGFRVDTLKSVKEIKDKGHDEQIAILRGRFTKQLSREHFEFVDVNGDMIICELDDDENWSHVKKDELVEVMGEIDKGIRKLELEVMQVRVAK